MKKDKIKDFLSRSKEKNRISNAYIIHGGDEQDRGDIAVYLSCLLKCRENPPCMECASCKLISRRASPDVRWIVPEKSILSIDEVRDVGKDIYITSYEGGWKVYIFVIERIRDEAANAFLKILEEPPPSSVLVISSSNMNYFLPTILSRCQKLGLNYSLPSGTEGFASSQEEFVGILDLIGKGRLFDFFQRVDALVKGKDREEIESWVEKAVYLCRKEYLEPFGVEKKFLLEAGVEAGFPDSEGSLLQIMEDVVEMKERIRYNINLKLGLESLFLGIYQLLKNS